MAAARLSESGPEVTVSRQKRKLAHVRKADVGAEALSD